MIQHGWMMEVFSLDSIHKMKTFMQFKVDLLVFSMII